MSDVQDDAHLRELTRARAPYVIIFGIAVVALSVMIGLHGLEIL